MSVIGLSPVKKFVVFCGNHFRHQQFAVLLSNVLQGLYLKINNTFWFGSIGNFNDIGHSAVGTNAIGNIPFAIQFFVIAINAVQLIYDFSNLV